MDKVSRAIDFLVEEDPLFSNPMVFDDKWLDEHVKGSWKRRPDGKIDVEEHLDIGGLAIEYLPYKFGKVTGCFNCANCQLNDLEGSPEYVGGNFDCSGNNLINLIGGPAKVKTYFDCSRNKLVTLEGGPEFVMYYNCDYNQLTSLTGAPEKIDTLYCSGNQLTSLEGAPKEIRSAFGFFCDQFSDEDYRAYVKEHYE